MRSLLDVNVLIALLDAEHVHHDAARDWMRENIRHGWATCPITQNGCLRIMAQPGYPHHIPSSLVAERLREAARPANTTVCAPLAVPGCRVEIEVDAIGGSG
jgi:predicted nucleic acid-binding protein